LGLSSSLLNNSNIQNEKQFNGFCAEVIATNDILGGVFVSSGSPYWKYSIVLNRADGPSTKTAVHADPDQDVNPYLTSGFFAIQQIVERSIALYEGKTNFAASVVNTSIQENIGKA